MTEYELRQLPSTEAGKRMFRRVSPIYDTSWFMRHYYDGLGAAWEKIRAYFTTLREQHFTQTVDWGIEYLERKYSLEPRPDLSLEERRARLKIKVAKKYPLNPAVLEKYARDNYDFDTYLDETTNPGHIRLLFNHSTKAGIEGFLKYLLEEKPAHLTLGSEMILVDFIGGGGEDYEPAFVVRDPESLIPKTDAEKKKVPRLFAGQAETHVGVKEISLPHLPDYKQKIYAGIALMENGFRGGVDLALPHILFGNNHRAFVGQALVRGGGLTINAYMGDLPTYEDIIESAIADLLIADWGIARDGEVKIPVEVYDRAYSVRLYQGAALSVTGDKNISLPKPADVEQKIFTGNAFAKLGNVSIDHTPERRLKNYITLRVGQTLYKTGNVTIDSATRPSIPEGKRYFGKTSNLYVTFKNALAKLGNETIKPGSQLWRELHKTVVRAGAALVKSGEIIINAADDDIFSVPEGSWLKMWFRFPQGLAKQILLANPREDLSRSDIRQIGDLAAADEIFVNDAGDVTTGLSRAALITQNVRKIFGGD